MAGSVIETRTRGGSRAARLAAKRASGAATREVGRAAQAQAAADGCPLHGGDDRERGPEQSHGLAVQGEAGAPRAGEPDEPPKSAPAQKCLPWEHNTMAWHRSPSASDS